MVVNKEWGQLELFSAERTGVLKASELVYSLLIPACSKAKLLILTLC